MKAAILLLAALEAGWMLYDGTRALITGHFAVQRSGPYTGRLGPWARFVAFVGINPRGDNMKWFFVLYGAIWLMVALAWAVGVDGLRPAMIVLAVGALWFAPIGTLFSVLQLILLLF